MNQKIIKICNQKLIYLNYSKKTSIIYLMYIQKFLKSFEDRQCIHLSGKDFQSYLDNYNFSSVSQQNQVINAIRFLYKHGLNKKYDKVTFQRPRREKKLPKVLDSSVIITKLNEIDNLKHRAILTLTFSVGLRASEVVELKIKDIDSARMLIHIRSAKGNKDRLVPLSANVLTLLREYFVLYNPKDYLFNGALATKYSTESCRKIYKKYIDHESSIHTLRHSSFTSLLESGTDLRVIQKIAGHSSSKTTEIYTHVSNLTLSRVQLPI